MNEWEKLVEQRKKEELAATEFFKEIKPVANRVFSTEDGKVLARQMIRACRMFSAEGRSLSAEDLQRLQAQKDFVNLFITSLVDRKVFLQIIEGL